MKLIDKDKVEEILRNLWKKDDGNNSEHRICYNKALQEVQCEIDTLEMKEIEEKETPKYGYLETVYYCGSEPRWKVGDILAEYQMYSDREGEYVHGKVVKVEYDEEYNDWYYTFEDGERLCEELLLTSDAYKKN